MAGFKHDVKRYPGFKPFTLLFFAYLYLPIAVVVLYSFNNSRLVSVWEGFGLKWYGLALANENLLNALKVSRIVAVIAMVAVTANFQYSPEMRSFFWSIPVIIMDCTMHRMTVA